MAAVHGHDGFLHLAIGFLKHCEKQKRWIKNKDHYFGSTCGYTGIGIALVLKLFLHNSISNESSLRSFLSRYNEEQFVNIINETIGNFVDAVEQFCPVTGVFNGIMGLIKEGAMQDRMAADDEPAKVYELSADGSNITVGVTSISFATNECSTFHHATLYIPIGNEDRCFIVDSWAATDKGNFTCRRLSYRQFQTQEVKAALVYLKSADISKKDDIAAIFNHFFKAHHTFTDNIHQLPRKTENLINVFIVNPNYIEYVYARCEAAIKSGEQTQSAFGGKRKKKKKKKKTIKKKYKIV